MKEFQVDLSQVSTWQDFIGAFNDGFIRQVGGEWNGNLDAFHDYLYWPNEHPYRLIVKGWHACYASVNEHKTWDDRPVLEVIAESFQENPQAEVVLT